MGLFDRNEPENENISSMQNTPADQHIINEVESEAKAKGVGGGTVERLNANSEELQRLLNEFKAMQGEGVVNNYYDNHEHDSSSITEEYNHEQHSVEEGEKYTLSAEENDQIEKYLVGEEDDAEAEEYIPVEESYESDYVEIGEDDDVIYIDEDPSEEVEEEYIEEVDEEIIEDVEDEVHEEIYEEYVEPIQPESYSDEEIVEEVVDDEVEEIIEEISDEEYVDYTDNDESELEEYVEDEVLEDSEEVVDEEIIEDVEDDFVEDYSKGTNTEQKLTDEEIDKKLDAKLSAFEEQLISKLMATMNLQNQANNSTNVIASDPVQVDESIEAEDLHFEGQVVIFEPLEKIKQATWEDVVRRKGHYTYHVTASSNGGWFIKRAKSPNPYAYLERKDEALKLAIVYAKREKAELKMHNEKGVIETSMSFGREKKIN